MSTPDKYLPYSHEMNYSLSIEKMKKKKEPSIIILGGSGCGFGFLSQELSEYYKMPVINTGTHAGIGLRLIMNAAMPYISEGDIVLLIPEYNHFSGTFFWGEDVALNAIFSIPEVYDNLSIFQKLHLLQYYPKHYQEVKESQRFQPNKNISDTTDATPYSRCSLNYYGDVTLYEKRQHRDSIEVVNPKTTYTNLVTIYQTKRFVKYAESKGARCIFLPPAFRDIQYDHDIANVKRKNFWLSIFGMPYMSDPERYRLPDSLFFDTQYHLTEEGCAYRTQLVIEDIDRILKKE